MSDQGDIIRYAEDEIDIRGLEPGSRICVSEVDAVDADIRVALVRLGSPILEARSSVEILTTDAASLADHLDRLHAEPPVRGRMGWKTIGDELRLAIEHDGLGHVTLCATLRDWPWKHGESSATASVLLEIAQLPRLAAEIRRLLAVPRR